MYSLKRRYALVINNFSNLKIHCWQAFNFPSTICYHRRGEAISELHQAERIKRKRKKKTYYSSLWENTAINCLISPSHSLFFSFLCLIYFFLIITKIIKKKCLVSFYKVKRFFLYSPYIFVFSDSFFPGPFTLEVLQCCDNWSGGIWWWRSNRVGRRGLKGRN